MKKLITILTCMMIVCTMSMNAQEVKKTSASYGQTIEKQMPATKVDSEKSTKNVIFFDGFEETSTEGVFPEGWTEVNAGSGFPWQHIAETNQGPFAFEGSYSAANFWKAGEARDAWLFSPAFELVAGENYTIEFVLQLAGFPSANEYDYFELKIGQTASAAGMEATPLYYNTDTYVSTWEEFTIEYTATASGSFYLGFHAFTPEDQGNVIGLDNIKVSSNAAPTPPAAPANLQITRTECNFTMTWETPAGVTNPTYNIYKAGDQVATNHTTNSYEFSLEGGETIEWCVETVAGGLTSETKACATNEACPVGINDNTLDNVTISPNPATTTVNITGDVAKVEIYNSLGQLVITHTGNISVINVSNFDAGVYFFKLFNANNETTTKQVIVK